MISEANAAIMGSIPATIVALIIGLRQSIAETQKIKLELYRRRFALYDQANKLRIALASDTFDRAKLEDQLRDFAFNVRESIFLFDPKHNVLKIAESMIRPAHRVIRDRQEYNRTRDNLLKHDEILSHIHDHQAELAGKAEQLEKVLLHYLDFRHIGGGSGFWQDYFWG